MRVYIYILRRYVYIDKVFISCTCRIQCVGISDIHYVL